MLTMRVRVRARARARVRHLVDDEGAMDGRRGVHWADDALELREDAPLLLRVLAHHLVRGGQGRGPG